MFEKKICNTFQQFQNFGQLGSHLMKLMEVFMKIQSFCNIKMKMFS